MNCQCEDHRDGERDPREGGWFCNECGIYFCTALNECPDRCGAVVDLDIGWAVKV